MSTSGTKEWADHNLNFQFGCKNNCRYCYAKAMAKRFKRITKDQEWETEIINKPTLNPYRHYEGRIMYPTSHDINPNNVKVFLQGLNLLLGNDNSILITTKPNLATIKTIIEFIESHFSIYTKFNRIQFRFTITSDKEAILKYWEPGAPSFDERFKALNLTWDSGFKTSVSIEPYLSDPIPIIEKILPFASESIWLGVMNKRCVAVEDYVKVSYLYEKPILQSLIELYQDHSKIRFKDSIQHLMKVNMKGRDIN